LIRHATVINEDLAANGLAEILSETLKEENAKVKRKALAALGEFMFYAATQLDDENAD
jgi:serine/threonine-protein kinase ULK4